MTDGQRKSGGGGTGFAAKQRAERPCNVKACREVLTGGTPRMNKLLSDRRGEIRQVKPTADTI